MLPPGRRRFDNVPPSLPPSLLPQYGNGTLRLTTRQTFQLHGVLKGDLKTVFSSVIKAMGSTLGACGDVNRNVVSPPAPYTNRPEYALAERYANDIADLLAPQVGGEGGAQGAGWGACRRAGGPRGARRRGGLRAGGRGHGR